MADSYKKDLLGFEDILQDTGGTGKKFSRETSTGGSQQISGMNAEKNPILVATRGLEMYDEAILNASEVDGAITSICANLASVHKFMNEAELAKIINAGTGTIISIIEREKLNFITSTGSGRIITDAERDQLDDLVGLNQEQVDAIDNIETFTPIGSITLWTTDTPPEKFFECHGATVSRETYSELFEIIGTNFGDGDGNSTFNIPDLRGRFARGWDHNAGRDPDASEREDRGDGVDGDSVGTLQDYDVDLSEHYPDRVIVAPGFNPAIGGISPVSTQVAFSSGDETRPININLMYIIRWGF